MKKYLGPLLAVLAGFIGLWGMIEYDCKNWVWERWEQAMWSKQYWPQCLVGLVQVQEILDRAARGCGNGNVPLPYPL